MTCTHTREGASVTHVRIHAHARVPHAYVRHTSASHTETNLSADVVWCDVARSINADYDVCTQDLVCVHWDTTRTHVNIRCKKKNGTLIIIIIIIIIIVVCYSYVSICYSCALVCYSHVFVCHSYVLVRTRLYSHVTVCFSFVLVWCFSHDHFQLAITLFLRRNAEFHCGLQYFSLRPKYCLWIILDFGTGGILNKFKSINAFSKRCNLDDGTDSRQHFVSQRFSRPH